jgi:hypothetical protein
MNKIIEKELSNLLIEKYLYNFICDFLYSPITISFNMIYNWGNIIIELPIVGSNYMILFDETRIKRYKNYPNIFKKIHKDKNSECVFQIIGDYDILDYKTYKFKKFTNIYCWFSANLEIIKYDTNLERKIINNDGYIQCQCYITNNND